MGLPLEASGGSLVAPWVRGLGLGSRPYRVLGLCVGVGDDRDLQGARLGIVVLDAFPFVEMTLKIPVVGVFPSCALRMECGFGKEGTWYLENSQDGGGTGGNVDLFLTSFFIHTNFLFFLPFYQINNFSSLEGEHL